MIMGHAEKGPTTCVSCFLFFAYPDILTSHFLRATPARHSDSYVWMSILTIFFLSLQLPLIGGY